MTHPLAALIAGVKVKPLEFNWSLDTVIGNPSCWSCRGDGFFAYVLIPYAPGNDPGAGIGKWSANPNHHGKTGFASRQEAMTYCEERIREQAEAEVATSLAALKRWTDLAALEAAAPTSPPPRRW